MEIRGIDVSAYNQVTNYQEVARYGIKVAIMRVTERGNQVDPTFYRNYEGFSGAGLKMGVYKYSYALNIGQAREEARVCLPLLEAGSWTIRFFMIWSGVNRGRCRNLP